MPKEFLFMDKINEVYRGGRFHAPEDQLYLQDMILEKFPDAKIKIFDAHGVAKYLNKSLEKYNTTLTHLKKIYPEVAMIGNKFRDSSSWIRVRKEQDWDSQRIMVTTAKNNLIKKFGPDASYLTSAINIPFFGLDMVTIPVDHSIGGIINPLCHADYRNIPDFYSSLNGAFGAELNDIYTEKKSEIEMDIRFAGSHPMNDVYTAMGDSFYRHVRIPIFQSYVFTPGHRNIPVMVGNYPSEKGADASDYIKSAFDVWLNSLEKK